VHRSGGQQSFRKRYPAHSPQRPSRTLIGGSRPDKSDNHPVRNRLRDTAEELPNLFERFHQADPSRARPTGGAEMGLTTAKQSVEAHGGYIYAGITLGHGSRFTFEIPLVEKTTEGAA